MEITVNGLTIKIIPDLRGVVEKPVRRTEPMETENMTGKNLSYELVNGNRFHVNALFIMKACHRLRLAFLLLTNFTTSVLEKVRSNSAKNSVSYQMKMKARNHDRKSRLDNNKNRSLQQQ